MIRTDGKPTIAWADPPTIQDDLAQADDPDNIEALTKASAEETIVVPSRLKRVAQLVAIALQPFPFPGYLDPHAW